MLVKLLKDMDFEAIFKNLPTPSMVMDVNFVIVAMNEAYLRVMSRDRESLIGVEVFTAFPAEGESRRMLQESFERVRDKAVVDVIPVLPYAIPGKDGFEQRSWSYTHAPILGEDGKVAFVLQNAQDISNLSQTRQLLDLPKVETQSLKDAVYPRIEMIQVLNQTLLATAHHLQRLFMQAANFMCVLHGPDHVFDIANLAFRELVGDRDLLGKAACEAVPELESQNYIRILDDVFSSGEAFVSRKMRVLLQSSEGKIEEHFLDIVCQPILGAKGEVSGVFIEGSDVTDHVRAEQRQALLIRELHHRVRNTLATVQGVMNTTAKSSATIEEFQEAFAGRIASMAKTHAVMTEELDQSVSFAHLLNQELSHYCDNGGLRIHLAGPAVDLPSQIAVPLGMAVHELTTNAAKYGALAGEEGRIDITWSLTDTPNGSALLCEWNETDGPTVKPPSREGFGSVLLKRVLSQQIGAEVKVAFEPEGFRLRMVVPLRSDR
ncbi:MAG: HWE histidine kinase domain-containing protein [Methylocella sp.]